MKRKLQVPGVAAELRKWREAKGWTRKQAAKHLGVNVKTLESWEYGTRKPPGLNALEKLWAEKRRA
jgi:transcriptional regulator with XRE-family HTH domain